MWRSLGLSILLVACAPERRVSGGSGGGPGDTPAGGDGGAAVPGPDTGRDGGPADGDGGPGDGDGGPGDGDGGGGDAGPAPLPDLCRPASPWDGSAPAFREATAGWGLVDLAVQGTRISVGDIDGDGWADLAVRRSGTKRDDTGPEGRRVVWLLRNTGDGGFEDVTGSSGFLATRRDDGSGLGRPAEIVVFADVDNDGDLDAFTGVGSESPDEPSGETSELLLGDGAGGFTLGGEDSPIRDAGPTAARASASFVDVDRDGLVDLWVGNGAVGAPAMQDQLYRGDGAGGFEDVTFRWGLQSLDWVRLDDLDGGRSHTVSWGVTACDLDGDGTPELLSASYGRAPNHLWQGRRDDDGGVRFRNRSVESGYSFDDRQDWTTNETGRCFCKLNRGAAGCADVPEPRVRCRSEADMVRSWNHDYDRRPFRLGGNSSTTVCADVTGDGALDLVTTEIVHWDVGSSSDPSELLVNSGEAEVRLTRPGNDVTGLVRSHAGVAWDDGDMTAAVFDLDNDGRPDVYIGSADYPGTRGHLFHQQADGSFVRVAEAVGIDHKSSHGVGVADLDRDGDLDLVIGHSRFRCGSGDHCYETPQVRLFENLAGEGGNWVQLALEGASGTNRSAIGARVTVTAGGRTQVEEVGGGHGHYGLQDDLVVHFGIGDACVAEVTVRWPDAALTEQSFTAQAGYRYAVVQGEQPEPAP